MSKLETGEVLTSGASSSSNGGNNGPSSDTHMPITSHKLTGNNYLPRSQSVLMFVKGKGKADLLTGEVDIPKKKDKAYKIWETKNKVMSWLVNSMTPEVGENFLLYETAREMWEAVKDTFSNKDNILELFSLEGHLHDLRQGELIVIE
ncbi:hypothetical protein LWI28_019566 [Acer negundo]|uniref:Retrotransposon Copia-like N-terminal domain-containing protein n=1 Tax=Acer negundo TaxID=4023 RepID=A0AAD5NZH3_ACENE|nr:hypothetical protein LWI28_019566 [Acer negundo]